MSARRDPPDKGSVIRVGRDYTAEAADSLRPAMIPDESCVFDLAGKKKASQLNAAGKTGFVGYRIEHVDQYRGEEGVQLLLWLLVARRTGVGGEPITRSLLAAGQNRNCPPGAPSEIAVRGLLRHGG